jgi:hypothetical protein
VSASLRHAFRLSQEFRASRRPGSAR